MASNVGDIQVADLLSQRVGVDTEQVGGAIWFPRVAASAAESSGNSISRRIRWIEAGRRDAVVEAGSVSSPRDGPRLRLGPRRRESRD
jgi:hypothetical protein